MSLSISASIPTTNMLPEGTIYPATNSSSLKLPSTSLTNLSAIFPSPLPILNYDHIQNNTHNKNLVQDNSDHIENISPTPEPEPELRGGGHGGGHGGGGGRGGRSGGERPGVHGGGASHNAANSIHWYEMDNGFRMAMVVLYGFLAVAAGMVLGGSLAA